MATFRDNAAALPNASTDASFRAWIQGMVTMLESAGWAQAADTGQLDEATVTYPAVVSTWAGSQMWYLNDSAHATYPLYMQVSWGRGSSSTRVMFRVQFGYATNGANAFVGWTSTVYTPLTGTDGPSAATGVSMASGGEGYGWFACGRGLWGSSAETLWVHVAREFDDAGQVADNGNWSLAIMGSSYTRPYVYSVNREYAIAFADSSPTVAIPFNTTQSSSATETELWKWPMKFPHVAPMATVFTYMAGDIQTDAPFQTDVSGAMRTYLPTGFQRCSYQYTTSHMAAMRWE